MMKVFGLPKCDSTKKLTSFLKKNAIEFSFHDFKEKGVDEAHLQKWFDALGFEKVLNKKSTTWRSLNAKQQAAVVDDASAIEIIMANPTLVKRPVLEHEGSVTVGVDDTLLKGLVGKKK
jgi:arsenate reductase (glutaredoxin)